MHEDCLFCKIVAGEVPCSKVYEDDDVLAFMDIAPITKGHTLVIPKAHHDPITATPDDVLMKLIAVVRKIAVAQTNGWKADGINVTQANGELAGQVIGHIHFHVIPRSKDDAHSWEFPQREYKDDAEKEKVAEAIRGGL